MTRFPVENYDKPGIRALSPGCWEADETSSSGPIAQSNSAVALVCRYHSRDRVDMAYADLQAPESQSHLPFGAGSTDLVFRFATLDPERGCAVPATVTLITLWTIPIFVRICETDAKRAPTLEADVNVAMTRL